MIIAMDSGYQTVILFDTQDAEFSRGFEAGRIWALMSQVSRHEVMPSALEGVLFHASNTEMVIRMIEAQGLTGWRAEIVDDTWMVLCR